MRRHQVHAAEDDDRCKKRVRVLMKGRVLQVVIVQGDEGSESNERACKHEANVLRPSMGECRIAHKAGSIDHGKLINQLHRVFQR